ncbi:MAG: ADP-forming succinate--CoA ligase subunit beta [Actinobacteria bacterium]|nr:ADP-forming succinate--CoA ligase subunit beta [Actinomycetota bacterium]
MDLFEWHGKRLFAAAGIPVPRGAVARTVDEACAAAETLGFPVVAKAQVLTGGRGKAGGVRTAGSTGELAAVARHIFDLTIRGCAVDSLLIEETLAIRHELYLAVTLDRRRRRPLLLVSAEGGMDIEQVARERPGSLSRAPLDPLLEPSQAVHQGAWDALSGAAAAARLDGGLRDDLVDLAAAVYRLYRDHDATLVELNPLAVVEGAGNGGRLMALDAKVTVDENALFRQPDLAAWRTGEDERERRAREAGVTYVTLDGDVGVIGNGAGLVMSTLDLIAAAGGRAANFCDIGGGARADQIAAALQIVTADERVRGLLVNVFGGITRGDEVARGLLAGLRQLPDRSLPMVVRLDGNNAAAGRTLLVAERPGLAVMETPWGAVRQVVSLVAEG